MSHDASRQVGEVCPVVRIKHRVPDRLVRPDTQTFDVRLAILDRDTR